MFFKQFLKGANRMKPNLYFLKKRIGRTIENQKTEVHFVVVDSDTSKDYPLDLRRYCVLQIWLSF